MQNKYIHHSTTGEAVEVSSSENQYQQLLQKAATMVFDPAPDLNDYGNVDVRDGYGRYTAPNGRVWKIVGVRAEAIRAIQAACGHKVLVDGFSGWSDYGPITCRLIAMVTHQDGTKPLELIDQLAEYIRKEKAVAKKANRIENPQDRKQYTQTVSTVEVTWILGCKTAEQACNRSGIYWESLDSDGQPKGVYLQDVETRVIDGPDLPAAHQKAKRIAIPPKSSLKYMFRSSADGNAEVNTNKSTVQVPVRIEI